MPKPAERIGSSNAGQRLDDRVLECLARARTNAPQDGFQLGKGALNGREIGRVGWQKQKLAASSFDGLPYPRSQVDREIVQDHDLPRAQAGSQNLLNVGLEGNPIRRSIQQHCFAHALKRQGGNQRQVRAVVAGNLAHRPFPSRGIGIQRSHVDLGPGFIHNDYVLEGQLPSLLLPRGGVLLAGSYGLFFRVQPSTALARLMLAGLTVMPWAA